MTFYVCTIAKRKNAKRHIVSKHATEAEAIQEARRIASYGRYKVQVCSGDWKYIYHL